MYDSQSEYKIKYENECIYGRPALHITQVYVVHFPVVTNMRGYEGAVLRFLCRRT